MPHEPLTVGSLFAGIGGIDLGLERAGMVTRWFVEWDAHCQNVLRRHWPGVPVYGDITTVDWGTVEPVDVLAGGFPCQPVSNAGKQLGTEDDRWLWPEFEHAVRTLRPRYVLVENVAALRHRGLTDVLNGLAAIGYDAEWDCIPAAAVGAPHVRDRLWIIAYPSSDGWAGSRTGDERLDDHPPRRERVWSEPAGSSTGDGQVADTHGRRRDGRAGEQRTGRGTQPSHGGTAVPHAAGQRPPRSRQPVESVYPASSSTWQTGQPLDGRLADQWRVEPDVGRVAHGVPHRVDRLRALGNAVVPQVVEWIGRRIVAFDAEGELDDAA